MAYKIKVAEPAHAGFEQAIAYIAVMLGSPAAASDLADEYERMLDVLSEMPELFGIHPLYQIVTGLGIRRCSVKNYSLFYYIEEDSQEVRIVAFLHERQDITYYLMHFPI